MNYERQRGARCGPTGQGQRAVARGPSPLHARLQIKFCHNDTACGRSIAELSSRDRNSTVWPTKPNMCPVRPVPNEAGQSSV